MNEYIELNEYIDRKRAIVDACNSLELYPSEYAKLEDALNKIPAAEVEPMKYGRWIVKQTALGTEYTICSNCKMGIAAPINGHILKLDLTNVERCPNCGAHMEIAHV